MVRRMNFVCGAGVLVAVALLVAAPEARAGMMLLPGQTVSTPGETYPVPGTAPVTELASQTVSFSGINPNFSGSVSVAVFKEAGGTLDFLYQVTNASSSAFNLAGITGSGYGTGNPFKTSVDFTTDNPDNTLFTQGSKASISATRTASGPQVTFNLGDNSTVGLTPGATSFILFVQTDATAFNLFGGIVVSGQNMGTINPGTASLNGILEPTAANPIPEPSSAVLLGLGIPLLGAWAFRRNRPKPA